MKIETVDFVEGAQKAHGIVVVIDVFRAFSVACYAFASGASTIIPVGNINDALQLRGKYAGCVLIGERGGKKLPGFDYGNSPTEIQNLDLSGKTVIHTTHAGTQGLVNAINADEILTGAFVNAAATAKYIHSKSPATVTLVRMGLEATQRSDEDDLYAKYLQCLLTDSPFELSSVKTLLQKSPFSDRFFDPQKTCSPATDFDLCLDTNKYDFVIRASRSNNGFMSLHKVYL